jgi:hypothetical protein
MQSAVRPGWVSGRRRPTAPCAVALRLPVRPSVKHHAGRSAARRMRHETPPLQIAALEGTLWRCAQLVPWSAICLSTGVAASADGVGRLLHHRWIKTRAHPLALSSFADELSRPVSSRIRAAPAQRSSSSPRPWASAECRSLRRA